MEIVTMKVFLFKHSVSLVYILGTTVVVLLFAIFLLFTEKNRMKSVNHALILQNDSIISEHIILKHQLLGQPFKSSGSSVNMSTLQVAK